MWEAGELEEHKEDELTGQVLPQKLTDGAVVVHHFLALRLLHRDHDEVNQLILQNSAPLLRLKVVTEVFVMQ